MAEVIWTEPAVAQLEAILDYIALDKPAAAAIVARRIFAATEHLGTFLALGRPIPEFRHPNFRQVWVKPCWVYYRTNGKSAHIVHVRRAERPLILLDLPPSAE